MGALSQDDLGTILVVLAVCAFGLAVWRAVLRDTLATVLLLAVGVILLLVAL